MDRSRPNLAILAVLVVFFINGGIAVLLYSQNVRIIDALGLSAGGATCGATMAGIIGVLVKRYKARSGAEGLRRDQAGSGPQPEAAATSK
jgi:hypothetical protein